MPADAWLLLVASIGLGLGLELAYMRARVKERRGGDARSDVGHGSTDGRGGLTDGGRGRTAEGDS